jgi:transposase-like protein
MQTIEKTRRKHFTKEKKLLILNELDNGAITVAGLARKHAIHPVTIHLWKRSMSTKPKSNEDYQEILLENVILKEEIENLKKALADIAVDNQITKAHNDVLKKRQRETKSKKPKKVTPK